MGICKCNQGTTVLRSDLFVPNIDLQPNQFHPKKIMRLKTLGEQNEGARQSHITLSTEKFIREQSCFNKTVIAKRSSVPMAPSHSPLHNLVSQEVNKNSSNANSSNAEVNQIKRKVSEKTNIQCEVTDMTLSTKEEKFIAEVLLHHYLFYKADTKILNYLFESLCEYQIEDNSLIFIEKDEGGSMFIIKKGKVELYQNNYPIRQVLHEGEVFGELALISQNNIRKYNAKALTPLEFYLIGTQSFATVAEELLTKGRYHIPFFKYIDREYQINLELFIIDIEFKKGHCITDIQSLFGIIEGKLKLIDKQGNTISTYSSNDIFGLDILFSPEAVDYNYRIIAEDHSKCFILPMRGFTEVCGLNFRHDILFSYFKLSIQSNTFFSLLCNQSNLYNLFECFKITQYEVNNVIYSASSEKKVVLLLDGELIFLNSKKIALTHGVVFGEEIINEDEYIDDIIAKRCSFVFECKWKVFCSKALINNYPFNDIINKVKQIYLFNQFKEKQLISIARLFMRVNFKKDDYIIKEGELPDKYYFIEYGEVREVYQNKTVRYYNKHNSFGELHLLNDSDTKSQMIASSQEVSLFYITKDLFFNLLGNTFIHSYIRNKIMIEDSEIFLKSLFYSSTLYKRRNSNVYIVHNKISLYALKAVHFNDKDKQVIPNIINERKAALHLDHPFIIKYAKTLKCNNWCFFLEEYVHGMTLHEYLDMCKEYQEKIHITFYGGSLFVILNYLHRIKIVHRNILLNNIVIDTSGYIRLLDFNASKKLKDNTTKTIIGTPLFIAPEVLNGKGYSFSCDYWSVGICLYYLYYGCYPFGGNAQRPDDVFKEILNK